MKALNPQLPRVNYNIDEAAEVLRISPRMVRMLISRNELPSILIGRRRLVSDRALRRLVADREAAESAQ